MKKILLLSLYAACCAIMPALAQTFTNNSSLLPASYNSGNCTGVVDMNNDGLDDIVILDQSKNLKIAYQQANGSFSVSNFGTVSGANQWGMAVGDIDNDGHKDVMSGGSYDNVHIVNINGPGDFVQTDLEWASIFMQCCNWADINNDGWVDGFACHDDGHSAILRNTGGGALVNGAAMIDLTFYPEINGNDNSGNYGSLWSDIDRDGDLDCMIAKCRQFINDPFDPRRTNVLLINDGNNNYTDQAPQRGLVNLQQSWTADMADVDNDGDFDCLITTHSGTLELYANNGLGYFTNVTAGSGLAVTGFFLQAKLADFDNDGFVDLIHSGGSHRYFRNNGNMTFTLVPNTFQASDVMHTFGIGDLNHDGWLDVYAGYGNSYNTPDNSNADRLFLNNGGTNNFIVFDLEGTISNKGAIGALVEIHGPWGVQIREVRAGESYGITNTSMLHFGIGTATAVDYAIIHWPAGGIKVINNPAINTWHQITETVCTPPSAAITANGLTHICTGQTVALQVTSAGANYQWNIGGSATSIQVGTTGNYSITTWDQSGCGALSNIISVEVGDDPVPTVSAQGLLKFCEGNSVQLTASEGNAYVWSNNQNSQTITVTQSGTYSVTVTGSCTTQQSQSIEVVVFDAPEAPVLADVNISPNNSATLEASGSAITWYESPSASTPLAEGSVFTTPVLSQTTSFWVQDAQLHGGEQFNGGKLANSDGQYQTSNGFYLKFDVIEDLTIESVKVYANSAGNRTIEVIDAAGAVVSSGTYSIPNGESIVNLNLFVPEGTGYGLRCATNNPGMWRDRNLDVPAPYGYPYNIGDVLTITGTNVSGANTDNYYYYFYDWNVQTQSRVCPSPRAEVQVIVTGVEELPGISQLSVYPNPVMEDVTVRFNSLQPVKLHVELIDQSGKIVYTANWNVNSGLFQRQLNLPNLSSGLYQLKLTNDLGTVAYPLVKQ